MLSIWYSVVRSLMSKQVAIYAGWNTSPVPEVCPNNEMVMFQPRTGTSPNLGPVAHCYVYFLVPPFLFISPPHVCPRCKPTPASPLSLLLLAQYIPTKYHPPTRESPVSIPACQNFPASLNACHTGSSAHLVVSCLCLFLGSPHHPLLLYIETSSSRPTLSLPMTYSCRRTLAASEIYYIVDLRCALGAVCLHQ